MEIALFFLNSFSILGRAKEQSASISFSDEGVVSIQGNGHFAIVPDPDSCPIDQASIQLLQPLEPGDKVDPEDVIVKCIDMQDGMCVIPAMAKVSACQGKTVVVSRSDKDFNYLAAISFILLVISVLHLLRHYYTKKSA